MNIGVDVGPTNTDAAALDDAGAVLATVKVASVQGDPVAGVVAALTALGSAGATRIAVGLRGAATAVAERAGLCRVAALRIGGPSAQAVRPFFGWPADLREAVEAGAGIVDGELGPLPVSLSADLGSLGLIKRENATILDAALSRFALDTAERLALALPGAAVFVTRGDGTLLTSSPRLKPGDSHPRGWELPVSPQVAPGTDPSRGLTPAPQAFHLSASPAAKTRTGRLGYRPPVRIHGPYQEKGNGMRKS
ncbi:hydantoinase/oxoprolinase N-terminal domain-containing protein [Streptosporangium roseum]|uniref:hydantoinase/oxoprolinase N-terminal domain-containing protein n=1 Tax=Streptosporangium roseum TaxID=2001 RepID=UPI0033316394